jgi:hypothetical protein
VRQGLARLKEDVSSMAGGLDAKIYEGGNTCATATSSRQIDYTDANSC